MVANFEIYIDSDCGLTCFRFLFIHPNFPDISHWGRADYKINVAPEYPNAVLLYSGNNYAGNCCIEKIWNYCTIDIQSEVVHFYEPYFGEFRQLEYQHRQSNNDIVAYHAGIPNKNLVIGVSSSIIGFRKPTLGISILNYHVSCPDGTWYQISINYESV